MTLPVQFRCDEAVAHRLDTLASAQGMTRAELLRSLVTQALRDKPDLNITRLNQVTEYSQAALAALVDKLLPGKQPHIVATTAQRLEKIHGQKYPPCARRSHARGGLASSFRWR